MRASKRLALILACLALAFAFVGSRATAQGTAITIWTKFNDQNPQNTQDQWLASMLKEYKEVTGNTATNIFQPYDQINSKLNVAVQAKGEVPDVSYVDSQLLGFFIQNGTLTDLTDWVKAQTWYADVDPQVMAACTTPDGKILCVPSHSAAILLYYWKDFYPDGLPGTTDKFLENAAKLKESKPNAFAFTGKLAEKASVERFYFGLIKSFGGDVADAEGKAAWANEATMKTVEFVREMFAKGYMAKESLAPGFDNEQPFMRGEAGAFVAGSYSYVYLAPLTAPDGTKYEAPVGVFDPKGLAVGAALEAGKLAFAPPMAAPGGKPYSVISASAWGIPVGAANVDAAKAFIDFQMTAERNAKYAIAYGALPALKAAIAAPEFQTAYWKGIAEIQAAHGGPAPALVDYDKGITMLADAIVKLITNPSLDIMAELQAAQDEYNAGLE